MEYRVNFLIQSIGMIINDFFLLFFWWVLFKQIGTIREYGLNEILLLYSVITVSFGLSMIFFGNQMKLSSIIYNGELDSYLFLPKPVLFHILISRIDIAAIGDFAFGICVFFLSGYGGIKNFILLILFGMLGAILFASFNVIVHSLSFYIGNSNSLSSLLSDTLMTFSTYPHTVYTGISKILLLTVLPAMYFSFIPVQIIKEFSIIKLIQLLAANIIFVSIAFFSFYYGLKKYESGNLITKKM
jgi:ABC-2 type transport system permease protein